MHDIFRFVAGISDSNEHKSARLTEPRRRYDKGLKLMTAEMPRTGNNVDVNQVSFNVQGLASVDLERRKAKEMIDGAKSNYRWDPHI